MRSSPEHKQRVNKTHILTGHRQNDIQELVDMPYAHPVPEENDGIPEKGNNLVNKVAGRDPPSQSRAVGESYWSVFSDPDIDIAMSIHRLSELTLSRPTHLGEKARCGNGWGNVF